MLLKRITLLIVAAAFAAMASACSPEVGSKEWCEELKAKVEAGEDFAALAKQHSACPSARSGGCTAGVIHENIMGFLYGLESRWGV